MFGINAHRIIIASFWIMLFSCPILGQVNNSLNKLWTLRESGVKIKADDYKTISQLTAYLDHKAYKSFSNEEIERIKQVLSFILPFSPKATTNLFKILLEEKRRNISSPESLFIRMLFEYEAKERNYQAVEKIRKAFPETKFPKIPILVSTNSGSQKKDFRVLEPDNSGQTINLKTLDLNHGLHLLIILNPFTCPVSRQLIRDFLSHKKYHGLLNKWGLLLPASSLSKPELVKITSWNQKATPKLRLHPIYKNRDFNILQVSVPLFVIVQNGKIISQFTGWKKGGGEAFDQFAKSFL